MDSDLSFDVPLNAEEAETTFQLNNTHIEKDNEKLFKIYECYLNNSDNDASCDSQSEISFDDDFTDIIKARIVTHSKKRTRQYSCLADIEKSVKEIDFRKSLISKIDDSNDAKLEFNIDLNSMDDKEVVELVNKLENDLESKMSSYPQIVANNLKKIYRKHIEAIKQSSDSHNDYVKQKSEKQSIHFDVLLSKELYEIKENSNLIEKLIEDLKLCEQLCHNDNHAENDK